MACSHSSLRKTRPFSRSTFSKAPQTKEQNHAYSAIVDQLLRPAPPFRVGRRVHICVRTSPVLHIANCSHSRPMPPRIFVHSFHSSLSKDFKGSLVTLGWQTCDKKPGAGDKQLRSSFVAACGCID